MNKVKKITAVCLSFAVIFTVLMFTPAKAETGNNYPAVLCHGNTGWGRDEMGGYLYWGGFKDLQKVLTEAGCTTYTAAVGPFSSNWDRACELYACIKGGTVDYGKAHSEKYHHSRYGKTYPGLYKAWGTATDGKINKVHLIGHSQGGQTERMLIQLLENGSKEEQQVTSTGMSPLFEGGKSWVASLTTFATPHDGTTIADYNYDKLKNFAASAISTAAGVAGLGDEPIFDFKLDQWGLKRESGESYAHYSERVLDSSIWDKSNTDFSFWDLSTVGAANENSWVKAQPDVYYFSYAACATMEDKSTGHQIANPLYMNTGMLATAAVLGSYTRNESGKPIIDKTWWPNDGVVNTISETGPKLNSTDTIVGYSGTPQIGKWNYMGTLKNNDHLDVVNRFNDQNDLYTKIAKRLESLPVVN